MRRFLLVFMMLLLPLQWSWAAAASMCEHERGATHLGHHEHRHAGAETSNTKNADAPAGGPHADCQVCHGAGVAFAADTAHGLRLRQRSGPPPAAGRHLPEPPIEGLLRPPAAFAA